ncbi:MAG TPA: SpoIIE family protein phosphatase, partial [Gracilimonas sp.]|nr:SpoIIE family protein phosphatase [Gracilimonas sp.]
EPDDIVVIYTDGITEAMNKNSEEFGLDRTVKCIGSHADSSASDILQQIYDEVSVHSGGIQQSDDITIMVIKRTA